MIGGFDYALQAVNKGAKVRREGWKPGEAVLKQEWSNGSKMTEPYLYFVYENGAKVPWTPTYADLFANDWGAD